MDHSSLGAGQSLEHISSRAQCLCLHREESLMSQSPANKAAYCIASQAGMSQFQAVCAERSTELQPCRSSSPVAHRG